MRPVYMIFIDRPDLNYKLLSPLLHCFAFRCIDVRILSSHYVTTTTTSGRVYNKSRASAKTINCSGGAHFSPTLEPLFSRSRRNCYFVLDNSFESSLFRGTAFFFSSKCRMEHSRRDFYLYRMEFLAMSDLYGSRVYDIEL